MWPGGGTDLDSNDHTKMIKQVLYCASDKNTSVIFSLKLHLKNTFLKKKKKSKTEIVEQWGSQTPADTAAVCAQIKKAESLKRPVFWLKIKMFFDVWTPHKGLG